MTRPTDDDLRVADEMFGFDNAGNRTVPPIRYTIAQAIAKERFRNRGIVEDTTDPQRRPYCKSCHRYINDAEIRIPSNEQA